MVVEYDDNGNVTKRTFKDKSQDTGIEADKDIVVEYVYDARDRLLTKKDKIGASTYASTTYEYGKRDNLTKVTDAGGDIVKTEYNEQLWKTKVTQETAGDDVITEYVYDDDGRTLTYRAKNNNTGDQETEYTYDIEGLKVTTEWPDGETTTQTYDLAGQRISTTDPIGTVVVRGYDADRRLTSIDITPSGGAVGTTGIDYAYDGLGRITSADLAEGAFTSVVQRSYNSLGKIESETQIIDGWNSGNGRTITYDWNVAGQKIGVTYPVSGDQIDYTRDELDRIDSIDWESSEIVDYTFSGKRLIGKDLPGSHEERTYDTFGRLTTIHHKDTSSGNTLLQLNYGYDDAHQIVSMDKMFFNDTTNTRLTAHTEDQGDQYAYDGAGRLVTVLRGVPTAKITTAMATNITNNDYDDKVVYTYDQTGNRLTMDVDGTATTYAYNVMNEMTTEAGASKSYDDNGNFEGTSNAYKYDWRNSLAYHDDGTDEWTWRFDAFGRRIQRDKLGVTNHQRSYWDGQHKIETVSYNSFANTETHKKTFVYGERIDELLLYVDVAANPDVEYYAHADHLGSIMLMVDDTGAIQESYRYTEWGEHRVVDDSFTMLAAGSPSTIGNPWRYTGRANAGVVAGAGEAWYDYRARHYRAGVGRFVQRDPLGYVDGGSQYLYVGNSPLMNTDPLGMQLRGRDQDEWRPPMLPPGAIPGKGEPVGPPLPGAGQGQPVKCDKFSCGSAICELIEALPPLPGGVECVNVSCTVGMTDDAGSVACGMTTPNGFKHPQPNGTMNNSGCTDIWLNIGDEALGPAISDLSSISPCGVTESGCTIAGTIAHELGHVFSYWQGLPIKDETLPDLFESDPNYNPCL